MNAKEYLSQAYYLDQRINSKLQQLDRLNDLATKYTAIITETPKSEGFSNSTLAATVSKIVDLQNEINRDIDKLLVLKGDITDVINSVKNLEYQTLLERRYLCFMSWKKIALDMKYEPRHIFRLHKKALNECKVLK